MHHLHTMIFPSGIHINTTLGLFTILASIAQQSLFTNMAFFGCLSVSGFSSSLDPTDLVHALLPIGRDLSTNKLPYHSSMECFVNLTHLRHASNVSIDNTFVSMFDPFSIVDISSGCAWSSSGKRHSSQGGWYFGCCSRVWILLVESLTLRWNPSSK